MKSKVKEMVKKGLSVLRDSEYVPAQELSDKLGMPVTAVFRLIRHLRQEGVGVHTTPKGYILSEFAKKSDDVHFMRRLSGRRASDFIAMRAAEPDIRKRWNGVTDKRDLSLITAPLRVDLQSIINGKKALLTCAERFAPTLKK